MGQPGKDDKERGAKGGTEDSGGDCSMNQDKKKEKAFTQVQLAGDEGTGTVWNTGRGYLDPGNGILNEIKPMLLLLCSHGSSAVHVVAGNSSVDQLWGANNKVLNDQKKHEIMAGAKNSCRLNLSSYYSVWVDYQVSGDSFKEWRES